MGLFDKLKNLAQEKITLATGSNDSKLEILYQKRNELKAKIESLKDSGKLDSDKL